MLERIKTDLNKSLVYVLIIRFLFKSNMKLRKSIYLTFLFITLSTLAHSQTNLTDSTQYISLIDSISKMEYYNLVDSMPEYPGGQNEMIKFFMNHFNYPSETDVCCRIYTEFIIDTCGRMTNIRILRGLQEDFDKETVRVLKLMPSWKPGKLNGIPVNVKYIFPVNITLQ